MLDSIDAPSAAGSAQETLPAAWYRDPARWPKERAAIFARSWLFAAHAGSIAPMSWRAETLAGYPILLVRDAEGTLRAFHNVCRHRAGPLTDGAAGACGKELVCRYHGWRYTLDGRLRSARDFGKADDFDPRELALFPVKLEIWRGLAFVALSDEAPPFEDFIAPLAARLKSLDWSDHEVALVRTHDLGCNWKTYVENYLEGYHVPDVHPGLDAEIVAAEYKVEMDGAVAIHTVPTRDPDAVYDGLWAWVWPNLAFNVYRRGLMLERMSPVGHAHTRLEYVYLMPPGESVPAETLAMSDAVTAEDKWIVERVQANLDAGIYATGRLSPKHEAAVAAFQTMVRQSEA